MPLVYKTFFTDPKELSVTVWDDETVVGVANAECEADAISCRITRFTTRRSASTGNGTTSKWT